MGTNKKFNLRAATTLVVLMSFLFIALSGTMLYLSPKGRVANWTGWSLLGLTKEGWAAAHTTMAILFLVASIIHLVYNWRPMMKYLKMPLAAGIKRSRTEMVAALGLTLVVFLGTLYGVPPFSTVGAVNEDIKDYWEARSIAGPYTHAEEDTLAAFAEKLGREPDELLARLASKGYPATDPNVRVKDLAAQYDISPSELFATLSSGGAGAGPARTTGAGGGHGYGRKTLAEVCIEHQVDLEAATTRLAELGIPASGADNVRTLANEAGMNPGEILRAAGIPVRP